MKILLVDDEILLLNKLKSIVDSLVPNAETAAFSKAREAMEYARDFCPDIAFLDINMRVISGLELARQLQELNPRVNIIFCTGYSEFALDAHSLHSSGYILKPATEEKVFDALQNLRYPVESGRSRPQKRLNIKCFGNFEALLDGKPLHFKYEKTRELLAYLVDRRGSAGSLAEIASVLWDDEEHMNYLKSLRRDLILTLEEHGCGHTLVKERGRLAILPDEINCDYYDWQNGLIPSSAYMGEYMAQYSWAEYTNGYLQQGK